MGLSNELISQFVKITNDNKDSKKETTVYGIVDTDGSRVLIDGHDSAQLGIPISSKSTVSVQPEDRVMLLIKNHTAIVTGNLGTPATTEGYVNATVDDKTKNIESSVIQKLSAKYITAEQIAADYVKTTTFNAKTATIDGTLNAHTGNIETLNTDTANINGTLTAHAGTIETLTSDNVTIKETLTAHNGVIEKLDSTYAKIDRVEAVEGVIEELDSTYAKITSLDAIEGEIDTLESKTAKIDGLIFEGASGSTMHANFANAVIALLGNAWIKSAMVESLDADKIAGDIVITEDLQVVSEDGHIVIKNGAIQVLDDSKNVRVQLGKDASNKYSITIWDPDGNKMFDAGGITSDAIKSDIIVNSMVSATADIDASKLNIDSLFTVINNNGTKTINATKVKLDETGQTLDVAFSTMETAVDGLQNDVNSHGSEIRVMKEKIESKVWAQDIETAKSELEEETTTLSTKYSTLEQTLSGVSAKVSEHTTALSKKADSSTVTAVNTKVSELETNLSGFKSTVSSTYATKTELALTEEKATAAKSGVEDLSARVSNTETAISQNTEAIELRATLTQVATARSSAIDSAKSYTDNNLKKYSTTEEMTAAIELSANSITSTVSSTYATKTELSDTQGSLDTTHALAESTNDAVVEAQSSIQQLSESISSLVTDGNGTSLMTQTEDGWTFSTASIQASVDRVSQNLNSLVNDVGDIDSTVAVLQKAIDDLGVTAEYIHIGTYGEGDDLEPCIELGETDSEFKLIITNTRIMFMEGSSVPAYITKQSLHITKAVIEEEIQQGEFVWKVRQNGNMGLMWKGGV